MGLNLSAQGKTYWDEQNSIGQNFYAVLGAHADAEMEGVWISGDDPRLTQEQWESMGATLVSNP